MLKYLCDLCGSEIVPPIPPTLSTPKINEVQIATIGFIDPTTGKQIDQMSCAKCTIKLKEFIETVKKENGIVNIGEDLNIKIK